MRCNHEFIYSLLVIVAFLLIGCATPVDLQEIVILDHGDVLTKYLIIEGSLYVTNGIAKFIDVNNKHIYIKDFKIIKEL